MVRTLFLEHLPPVACSLLATSAETDLDALAAKGNLIIEAHSWGQPNTMPVSLSIVGTSQANVTSAPSPLASNPFESLKTELGKISSRLGRLENAVSKSRSQSQDKRSRSKSADRSEL